MKTDKAMIEQLLLVIHSFNRLDGKARSFGTDRPLYLSEIHLIAYIYDLPESSVTDVAKGLGITKGAVSQLLKKLVNRGYVIKEYDPANRSRCLLSLTEKGATAARAHLDFHDLLVEQTRKALEGYTEQDKEKICAFLKNMENIWDS